MITIGELARATGVSAKMIRYYESVGILPEAQRDPNNYRIYTRSDVELIQFVKNVKALDFDFESIKQLVGLYVDHERTSSEVKELALAQIDFLTERIAQMEKAKQTLSILAKRCPGDEQPDCPILDELSSEYKRCVKKEDKS